MFPVRYDLRLYIPEDKNLEFRASSSDSEKSASFLRKDIIQKGCTVSDNGTDISSYYREDFPA
jgi:hypothetical protein